VVPENRPVTTQQIPVQQVFQDAVQQKGPQLGPNHPSESYSLSKSFQDAFNSKSFQDAFNFSNFCDIVCKRRLRVFANPKFTAMAGVGWTRGIPVPQVVYTQQVAGQQFQQLSYPQTVRVSGAH